MPFAEPLVIGAALLAVWLDVRLDKRRPASPTRRIGHALAAYVLLHLSLAGSDQLLGPAAESEARLIVLFGLLLPSLVYTFVVGLWLMRTLADVAGLARR